MVNLLNKGFVYIFIEKRSLISLMLYGKYPEKT